LAGIGGFVAGLRAITEEPITRVRAAGVLAGISGLIAGFCTVAEESIVRTRGRARHTGAVLTNLAAVAEDSVIARGAVRLIRMRTSSTGADVIGATATVVRTQSTRGLKNIEWTGR
jgi:hypothetical protein